MSRARYVRIRPLRWAPAAALILSACATTTPPGAGPAASPPSRIEGSTSAAPADIAVPRDGDPAKLAQVIAALTAARAENPSDAGVRIKLAEANYVMAESIAVLGWKNQGEPEAHWDASIAAVEGLEDGAALYWRAASLYARAQHEGYGALLDAQSSVERLLSDAVKAAPNTDRGGAYRILASLAAHPADPSLRDLKRARQLVDAALAIDARAAANVSAFIEHYAVPAHDRAALTEKLQLLGELQPAASDDAVAGARAEQLAATVEDRLE